VTVARNALDHRSHLDTARHPGCTDACRLAVAYVLGDAGRSEVRLHDAAAHEAYGAEHANDLRIVSTGPLVVDLGTSRVYVEGAEVRITPREWGILEALARRPGAVVAHADLLSEGWGPESIGDNHMLRIAVTRLRQRLGSASPLIVNRMNAGYLLEMAPPIAAALVPLAPGTRTGWARGWDACRSCRGGLCSRCARRQKRGAL
jgi:hypothetical protein